MAGIRCTLCRSESQFFCEFRQKRYLRCSGCLALLMDPACHPTPEQERGRYLQHNNDINDPGYRSFVMPLVDKVTGRFTGEGRGLDFGAGTGPVVHKLLSDRGYSMELYDPFFRNDRSVLEKQYDFIVCCEVIEHFHNPYREFRLLRSLLSPGGSLLCMTELFSEERDFLKWTYKNDATHVFFYHKESIRWIKSHFGFSSSETEGRIIHFVL